MAAWHPLHGRQHRRETPVPTLGSEAGGNSRAFAHQQKLVGRHGDKLSAMFNPAPGVWFCESEDARDLARLFDARQRIGHRGLNFWMPRISQMPEIRGKILRTDKNPIYAINRCHFFYF